MRAAGDRRRGAIMFAVALIVAVAIAAWQVSVIPAPPAFTTVGPGVMPTAVVVVLGLIVLLYLVQSLRGASPDVLHDTEEGPLPGRIGRTAWLAGGLAALLLLIPTMGIGIAGIASFMLIARAFDSRRPVRDVVVGVGATFSLWYLFDRLLGVQVGPFVTFLG
jgi:putative tricarboxylic transport membrane protein